MAPRFAWLHNSNAPTVLTQLLLLRTPLLIHRNLTQLVAAAAAAVSIAAILC